LLAKRCGATALGLGWGELGFPGFDGLGDGGVEDVAKERGFSRAAGAGDHDQAPERQVQINAAQVAQGGAS